MILRHLLSIFLLPFMVVLIIPRWLLRVWSASDTRWIDGTLTASLSHLARRLVAVGPYRYVRNPMISGVLTMLVGEMLFLGSRVIGIWAATFIAINQVYFMLLEEPGLERRFGTAYREYKLAVPRWIPRATPWKNG